MKEIRITLKSLQRNIEKKNRDKLNEYFKSYRQINKESIKEKTKEKVNCECGCLISKGKFPRHRTTEKTYKTDANKCNDIIYILYYIILFTNVSNIILNLVS